MAYESIFADEWRECLQAQYQYVVRNNDQITLKSLVPVMLDVGFREDELREFAFQATLRAEDVADDFVPDMDIMSGAQPVTKPEAAPEADVLEEVSSDDLALTLDEALAVAQAEPSLDAGLLVESGAATEAELEATLDQGDPTEDAGEDAEPAEPEPKLPPGVTQLSLF